MEGRITQGYQQAFGWWNVLTILIAIIDSLVYRSVNLIKLYTFNMWRLFHDNYMSIKQALKMSRTGGLVQKALASLSSIMDYNYHWKKAGGQRWMNVKLVRKEFPSLRASQWDGHRFCLVFPEGKRVYSVLLHQGMKATWNPIPKQKM